MKVTDKRMFTADGELREDYRHVQDERPEPPEGEREQPPTPEPTPAAAEPKVEQPAAPTVGPAASATIDPGADPSVDSSRGEADSPPPGGLGSPGFMELISVLAEPIAVYLGDAKMPDGSSAENPEAARFYIDLLEVLQQKTAGNLSAQEAGILEDLLYQLRMRYVRQRG